MPTLPNKLLLILTLTSSLTITNNALASKSDDSWIANRQGMYLISKGQIESAISEFEKACQLDPFNDTALANLACARNNLGVSYAKQLNYKEAIRQFKNAKAQKPEDVSIRLNLLSTLVTMKDADETEKEIKELLKLRPNVTKKHSNESFLKPMNSKNKESAARYSDRTPN